MITKVKGDLRAEILSSRQAKKRGRPRKHPLSKESKLADKKFIFNFKEWWRVKNLPIFAVRLKEVRTKLDLSQHDFAQAIGFTKSAIALYESGRRDPSYDAIERIADFTNTSVDYLMGRSDNPVPPKELTNLSKEDIELAQILNLLDEEDKEAFKGMVMRLRKDVKSGKIEQDFKKTTVRRENGIADHK